MDNIVTLSEKHLFVVEHGFLKQRLKKHDCHVRLRFLLEHFFDKQKTFFPDWTCVFEKRSNENHFFMIEHVS